MSNSSIISSRLLERLRCPYERGWVSVSGTSIVCSDGHNFPVVEGVPVMLREDVTDTLWVATASMQAARSGVGGLYVQTLGLTQEQRDDLARIEGSASGVDPVVSAMVGATSGFLYKDLVGKLADYPIPKIRIPPASGARSFLDVGCNWGRWLVAAARVGYEVVGVDPSLGAVLAAKRVLQHFGLRGELVVADARYLPFAEESFDVVFSYSVLQHFSDDDASPALREIGRVLRRGGVSMIQMANRYGIRSFYHQMRRGFADPTAFNVRYRSPSRLVRWFNDAIGRTKLSVDGFFGLGIQPSDMKMLNWRYRLVIVASEVMRYVSFVLPPLKYVADSVYLESAKQP